LLSDADGTSSRSSFHSWRAFRLQSYEIKIEIEIGRINQYEGGNERHDEKNDQHEEQIREGRITHVAIKQIEYSFDSEKSQMNILHPFQYTANKSGRGRTGLSAVGIQLSSVKKN